MMIAKRFIRQRINEKGAFERRKSIYVLALICLIFFFFSEDTLQLEKYPEQFLHFFLKNVFL